MHLWGPFAFFAVVRGDDGDLPETSASSRARFCPAHYCEKCNEQLCSRLAQRTSNCGNWTTWGQMAASWKRTRLDKQHVAICSSNTAVKDLARCSSDMHDRSAASERALREYLRGQKHVETATCCLSRRVRFQDAAICPQVVRWPQFEVRCARREHSCSLHFSH